MSAVQEMAAATVSRDQLRELNAFASTVPASLLRDFLDSLISSVEDGSDVVLLETGVEFTPHQVAARLNMSRTHLYALLDSGAAGSPCRSRPPHQGFGHRRVRAAT